MTPRENLAKRLEEAYAKVEEWPEHRPDGFVDLLALRNLVPEAIAELSLPAAADAREMQERCAQVASERLEVPPIHESEPIYVHHGWEMCAREILAAIRALRCSTTPAPAGDLTAAIRAGCTAADVHLTCSYPNCTCKQIPAAVKAALAKP